MAKREQCWVTEEFIDEMGEYGNCYECHCMNCPVKTGFAPGPKLVEETETNGVKTYVEVTAESEKKPKKIREQCWATGEWIDEMGEYGNCYECHCMSCPVNSGFEPGPKKVEVEIY